MNTQQFVNRHISLNEADKNEMLRKIGVSNIEELVSQTIPASIRLEKDLSISEPLSEYEMLSHSKALASENSLYDTYIGWGYHDYSAEYFGKSELVYSIYALSGRGSAGKVGSAA